MSDSHAAGDIVRTAGISLKELSASAAERAERELIFRTLNEVNWNRKQAAQRLNICYKSLLNKLHRWRLQEQPEVARRKEPADDLCSTASMSGD